MTTDVERAAAFYGAVIGWNFTDLGPEFGGYRIADVGGAQVAAIGPSDAPTPWALYLAVEDVDAAVAAAVAAGGKVLLPVGDVGAMGRAARIEDPGGAPVGLWQAGEHSGFGGTRAPGMPAWFEVNTRHGAQVRDFFAGLFGLEPQKMDGMEYYSMVAEGSARFGVLQMNKDWDGMDPSWMAYFAVEDVDAGCARVTAAEGVVEYAPFDTPWGRIAICRDPMGMPFTVIQLSAA